MCLVVNYAKNRVTAGFASDEACGRMEMQGADGQPSLPKTVLIRGKSDQRICSRDDELTSIRLRCRLCLPVNGVTS
jgi:hypothetical protein